MCSIACTPPSAIEHIFFLKISTSLEKLLLVMRNMYSPFSRNCFPGGSEVKASACNAGDLSSIPGLGRPPGEGNGNPLQYSCLENPMDRGAWWATVHGVTKSRTRLSDFTFTFPLQQNLIYTDLTPCLIRAVSQSYLKSCLLGCSPHFAPNETTHNSHIVQSK